MSEKGISEANRRFMRVLIDHGLEYLNALRCALVVEEGSAAPQNEDADGETQKRKRRTKAEMEAARKAEGAKTKEASTQKEPEAEEEAEEKSEIDVSELGDDDLSDFEEDEKEDITPEDVRGKLVEYAQRFSKEKAYAVLEKYAKSRKTADVKPADLPKLFKELDSGLKK